MTLYPISEEECLMVHRISDSIGGDSGRLVKHCVLSHEYLERENHRLQVLLGWRCLMVVACLLGLLYAASRPAFFVTVIVVGTLAGIAVVVGRACGAEDNMRKSVGETK